MVVKAREPARTYHSQPLNVTIDEIEKKSPKQLYSLFRQIRLRNRCTMKKDDPHDVVIEYILKQNVIAKKVSIKTNSSAPLKSETVQSAAQETGIFIDWGLPVPDHYNNDRIVAMVRDPYWIFIYWEIESNNGNGKKLISSYGEDILKKSQWILRVQFLDGNIREDIPIAPKYKSWYLQVNPNGRYQVKVGLLTPDNIFIALANSKIVKTPPAYPSDNTEGERSINEEKFREMMKSAGIDIEKECWSFAGSSLRHWSPSFILKK